MPRGRYECEQLMLRALGRIDYECEIPEDELVLQVCLEEAQNLLQYRRERLRAEKQKHNG